MIEAHEFVEAAAQKGLGAYAGVPCSFLTPFINYVIGNQQLHYVNAANEGDAVAIAAGLSIGGKPAAAMMQNSGLGNAVSPLTSLSWTFRIPLLLICTHRGAAGVKDEPQHELMGSITETLFDTMQIPVEAFPQESAQIIPTLQRASDYFRDSRRPYALLMAKGSVASGPAAPQTTTAITPGSVTNLSAASKPGDRASRREVLEAILELTDDGATAVFATTGFSGRELYALADRSNHLYMVGSMGCASSLALGFALARPDLRVLVIDGDGAALMRMGNFATLGACSPANLVHVLLDNGVHDSTGAQHTVSHCVNFAAIAAACSYRNSFTGDYRDTLASAFKTREGPTFVQVETRPGTIEDLPRPAVSPVQVLDRFMAHFDCRFHSG